MPEAPVKNRHPHLSWKKIRQGIWRAGKEFFQEDGIDKSSVLAYYSIFSSFFLSVFFVSLLAQLGASHQGSILKNIYPFSAEFFSRIAPVLFQKETAKVMRFEDLGLLEISIFLFLGILIFKKIIQFINAMFHITIKRGFFVSKRIKEFGLLLLANVLVIASVLMTWIISAVSSVVSQGRLSTNLLSPELVTAVDSLLIKYLVPLLITFLLFYILYKWIPEKRVCTPSALIAAGLSALVWEIVKRGYTLYLINISLIGKIQGPVIAVILFGFWMELSMGIMLYGAKLTYLLDKEKHG